MKNLGYQTELQEIDEAQIKICLENTRIDSNFTPHKVSLYQAITSMVISIMIKNPKDSMNQLKSLASPSIIDWPKTEQTTRTNSLKCTTKVAANVNVVQES